jgi:cytoskeleton protein RodZ
LAEGASAGALLRAAREKQGLHVAALAAAIKIPQRKLEALEADRFDELPDATFARALALTVCRALKIDPAPVLAHLPRAGAAALADVAGGLNAPFRERSGRSSEAGASALARHPLVWAGALVLLAALAMYLLPAGWWQSLLPAATTPSVVSAPAATAAAPVVLESAAASSAVVDAADAQAEAASAPAVEVVHSVPTGASAPADVAGGVLVLRASDASWVEVIDGDGQVLVRRALQPGESLGLDGQLPFKLKIGNAVATQLQFRGQDLDLTPFTRDNIVRMELK